MYVFPSLLNILIKFRIPTPKWFCYGYCHVMYRLSNWYWIQSLYLDWQLKLFFIYFSTLFVLLYWLYSVTFNNKTPMWLRSEFGNALPLSIFEQVRIIELNHGLWILHLYKYQKWGNKYWNIIKTSKLKYTCFKIQYTILTYLSRS